MKLTSARRPRSAEHVHPHAAAAAAAAVPSAVGLERRNRSQVCAKEAKRSPRFAAELVAKELFVLPSSNNDLFLSKMSRLSTLFTVTNHHLTV